MTAAEIQKLRPFTWAWSIDLRGLGPPATAPAINTLGVEVMGVACTRAGALRAARRYAAHQARMPGPVTTVEL